MCFHHDLRCALKFAGDTARCFTVMYHLAIYLSKLFSVFGFGFKIATMGVGALFRILRDEYQGWKQFPSLTGSWPLWSILCSAVAAPLLFLCATILILVAFENTQPDFCTGLSSFLCFLLRSSGSLCVVSLCAAGRCDAAAFRAILRTALES